MVPNSRACSQRGSAPRDSSGSLASGETISSKIVSVRLSTGETPGSRPLQRQKYAVMVPNSRACSRGGSAPKDSSGSLASGETISPRIVSVRSNDGETPGSRLLQRQAEALRAERLFMQESFYSLPGSVPSGPPDRLGVVREPLSKEDTCHRSEHTTRHQKQSRISELNRIWDDRKSLLADTALNLKDKQNIVRRMARTGTGLVLLNDRRVGDVATGLGGTLVLPPLSVNDVKHHFGNVKGFPGISVLVDLIKHGVPVVTSATPTDPRQAFQYGNHSSVQEHMSTVWEKLCEDVRRNRCLVFTREAAEKIVGLRIAPLGAVVTHKVRIINDYSFDPSTARGEKEGLNRDTISEEVPPCLCGEALPALLNVLTDLRIRFPNRRILLAKADVTEEFRNVRVAPDQAQTFGYMVDDVLVADFRLTFGWAGSPGHWGAMSEAAAHSHQNTTVESAEILCEGKAMMSHVKIIEPWEVGRPRLVSSSVRVKNKDVSRDGPHEPFFATVYVDDFIMARVQADPTNQSALVASASLASDHIRLFGSGEAGATPMSAPRKSTDWDTTVDLLGFTVNTHTLRISVTEEKIAAIRHTLEQEWPFTRKKASAQEVLSVTGKL